MAINPIKPKFGDTVKVTIEGLCTDSDSTGFQIRMDNGPRMGGRRYHSFVYDSANLVDVEVTMRFRKAGDLINRDDILSWKPNPGTIIAQDGNTISWMKTDQDTQWVNSQGSFARPSALPGGCYRIKLIA